MHRSLQQQTHTLLQLDSADRYLMVTVHGFLAAIDSLVVRVSSPVQRQRVQLQTQKAQLAPSTA